MTAWAEPQPPDRIWGTLPQSPTGLFEGRGHRDPAVHVLVVEDDPADADLVRAVLQDGTDRRIHVECVPRLAQAEQRLLDEDRPDVVLLDLRLPDGQGLEVLDRVLKAAQGVPVVVLTGSDDRRAAAEAVQRGAQDYLRKDVLLQSGQLTRAIWHSLERQRLLREAQRQSRLARAAELELRRLVESNLDGMVVLDEGSVVLFANRAAERLLGGNGDLLGSHLPLEAGWDGGKEIEVTLGNEVRCLEPRVSHIEWNGAPARLLSLRDVTERRAADQMRTRLLHSDRLRSIGQLAAGVAHEINNPAAFVTLNQEALRGHLDRLAAAFDAVRDLVRGWGEAPRKELDRVLERLETDAELAAARTTLAENRAGLDRIVAIVRSLRGFARVEEGHVERVRIDELVEDACTMVHNEIRHRATLVKDLGAPPPVVVDRGRLTQVMVNLLVNAAHALDEGRSEDNRITVRTWHAGDTVHVTVEDTGQGIPEAQQRRIFEPFFTTKGREHGTGLGLSLSAEIVRQHRGEIRFESEVGVGTRFEVCLPIDTGLEVSRPAKRRPSSHPPRQRLRVLLIDDEEALLRGLRRQLGSDHEVVTALGGQVGLDRLAQDRRFDLILCDLMMPGVDGPAVHAWIEAYAPELVDRIAFMSGGAFTPRARSFTDRTGVRVVDKPLDRDALAQLIKEAG